MQLFYCPKITTPLHTLNEEESKHCINVLRLKPSDIIYLIDGAGGIFEAKLINNKSKACEVEITSKLTGFNKHNYYLHIAIAPTKNMDRYEWFIEKAVEMGIDEITPIICDHSERKVIKVERLEKIAIAAMKQSLKTFLPRINEPISFINFINIDFNDNKYIAHCAEGNKKMLKNCVSPNENALILIGAEGDFSINEIDVALKANYSAISLGNSRLRTETAGIAACHTVALINQTQ